MGRIKTALSVCFAVAIYLACGWQLVGFLTTGRIYVRFHGESAYAEHPAGVILSVAICGAVIAVGTPLAAYFLIRSRREGRR